MSAQHSEWPIHAMALSCDSTVQDDLDDVVADALFHSHGESDRARHPDCRDPNHPGCKYCIEELDDE